MARTHEVRGKGLHASGVIALAATAIAGAAALVLLRTRAGQEARARLRDGDLGRRLQDTMDDVQRVADRGAALLERAAAAVREATRSRRGMLDAGAHEGD